MIRRFMDVSIIIPTYNVAPYIKECLESVASQTYCGTMECIVVDDCGTDESIPFAQEFIDSYFGEIEFHILHREKNGGLSAARNSGLDEAKGDFVFFLDSDDYITPHAIEQLVMTANAYPDAQFVQGSIVNSKKHVIFDAEECELGICSVSRKDIYASLVFGKLPVSSWNKLFRRDFLQSNGIRFYEGVIHEDVDFIYKVARCVSAITICKATTYVYRELREGSILSSTNNEKSTRSRILVYNACLDNIDNKYQKILTRSIFVRIMYVLQTAKPSGELADGFSKLCKKLLREAAFSDRMLMAMYLALPSFAQRRLYHVIDGYMRKEK